LNKPSKKIWFFVIPVVLVLVVFVFVYKKPAQQSAQKPALVVKDAVFQETDSDSDGLKDWEEALWKLDPLNPDTDGNGEDDNSYIKRQIDIGTDVNSANYGNEPISFEEDDSEIDKLGKELFAEYIELKKTDSVNQANIELVTDRLINKYTDEVYLIKEYALQDIKTYENANASQFKIYGIAIASVRDKYASAYSQNSLTDEDFYSDRAFDKLAEKLSWISDLYEQAISELLLLPVPKELADYHLALVNSYSKSALGLSFSDSARQNPILMLSGFQAHIEASDEEEQILSSLALFFQTSGIIFSNNEAGGLWNSI